MDVLSSFVKFNQIHYSDICHIYVFIYSFFVFFVFFVFFCYYIKCANALTCIKYIGNHAVN